MYLTARERFCHEVCTYSQLWAASTHRLGEEVAKPQKQSARTGLGKPSCVLSEVPLVAWVHSHISLQRTSSSVVEGCREKGWKAGTGTGEDWCTEGADPLINDRHSVSKKLFIWKNTFSVLNPLISTPYMSSD